MTKNLKEGAPVAYFDSGVDEPGFYELEGDVEVDGNGIEHHTQMTPGKRVYATEDGFSYEESESGDE